MVGARETDRMADSIPFFSIVVPTHERPTWLRSCLRALTRLNYPRDRFEVIVVNDGGDSLTPAEQADLRHSVDLVVLDQPRAGPASARNNGAIRARGDYLVFTDDDCTAAPDWLRALERTVRAHPAALVGGRAVNALEHDLCAMASQLLIEYLYDYYHSGAGHGPRFFTSNNMCVPAAAFRELGGFDSSFRLPAGEDRDFCDRWMATERALVYAPDAIVWHRHAMNLRSFTRQHLNYGRGAWAFHRARARRNNKRVRVEPWSFYAGLVAFPLTKTSGPRAALLSALLAWSQLTNAAGYFWARTQALG